MKLCKRCSIEKEIDEFNVGDKYCCRTCRRALINSHYNKNKEKYKEYNDKRRISVREFVHSLKGEPCLDCKQSFPPPVMEYHHLNPSKENISIAMLISNRAGKKKILSEIEKCVLLCANCHRIRHIARGDFS